MTKNLMEYRKTLPGNSIPHGTWVRYETAPFTTVEFGRVLREGPPDLVFKDRQDVPLYVVFKCDENWEHFKNYTPQRCSPCDLFPLNPLDFNLVGIPRLIAAGGAQVIPKPTVDSPLDANEVNLLLYLEDRAVNDFGVINMERIHGDLEAVFSSWSQLGLLDYGDIKNEHLSPQNPEYRRWVKLSETAYALAARERRRCAERKFEMWRERFTGSEVVDGK